MARCRCHSRRNDCGSWISSNQRARSTTYTIPLQLRGALNVAALESTLNELIRRHEVLRTTFKREWTGTRQQIHRCSAAATFADDGSGRA